jgi:hypothetical protein
MSNQEDEKPAQDRADEATPLCQNCLKEVDANAYYCPHCNSPTAINPKAKYMPFEQIKDTSVPMGQRSAIYGILAMLLLCMVWTWLSLIVVPLSAGWIIKNPRLQTKLNLGVLTITGIILAWVIGARIISGKFFWPIF